MGMNDCLADVWSFPLFRRCPDGTSPGCGSRQKNRPGSGDLLSMMGDQVIKGTEKRWNRDGDEVDLRGITSGSCTITASAWLPIPFASRFFRLP